MELFSRDEQDQRLNPDINYLDDLKFFIDNNNELLSKSFFPAIKKQKEHPANDRAFMFYMDPVKLACERYCKEYDLADVKDEIFTDDALISIAKRFAEEQGKHITKGAYD